MHHFSREAWCCPHRDGSRPSKLSHLVIGQSPQCLNPAARGKIRAWGALVGYCNSYSVVVVRGPSRSMIRGGRRTIGSISNHRLRSLKMELTSDKYSLNIWQSLSFRESIRGRRCRTSVGFNLIKLRITFFGKGGNIQINQASQGGNFQNCRVP